MSVRDYDKDGNPIDNYGPFKDVLRELSIVKKDMSYIKRYIEKQLEKDSYIICA